MPQHSPNQRGSIYVLTLFTVAAVGSMVLIGVAVRSSTNSQSMIIEKMNANRSGVLDAAELAIAKISEDVSWPTKAQKGVVFEEFTIGDSTYSSSVIDADTLGAPTDSTENYRVKVTSVNGIAAESASLDINYTVFRYLDFLDRFNLSAYWPLDEAKSSTRADDPIAGRDGTYLAPSNAGTEINDEGGVVPVFKNSNDHVETPYDSDYSDDQEGTVTFWMKLTGSSTVTTYGIFGQRFTTNGMPAVSMTCIAGSLMAYMDDGGSYDTSHFAQTRSSTITVGQWHHVAMSWGPEGLCIYVDGTLQAQNKTCLEYWDTQNGFWGQQPLIIGGSYIPAATSQPQVGFEGSIARFGMMQDQLSSTEIGQISAQQPDERTILLVENSWAAVYE
ncbi:MAG: LamG-like jellyroll fold domain-containing protein [Phycisphaerales bacterium]